MVQPVTVGLDIAKNVFHAYGVDAHGLLRRVEAVPGWNRSLRNRASLGPHDREAGPSGPAHAAGICEALCEALC